MEKMTERQKMIYSFIKNSIDSTGFPPTIREIGENFGITVKGAYDHLKAIEKKGYLTCTQNKSRAIVINDSEESGTTGESMRIPIYGAIAAGAPILANDNIEDYLAVPSHSFGSGNYFALRVKGDSMIDEGILDGDIAVIRKQETANNGEIVAALIDEEATLKRFKREGNLIKLIPANSNYREIIPDNCAILGRLAGIFRVYKN